VAENSNTTTPDLLVKAPPLSPHLQIYKPQVGSSILSILHRFTGMALSLGTILLVVLLVATSQGSGPYDAVQGFIGSFLGQLMLLGWTWALYFHLGAGIRHLAFDAGYGFAPKTATTTAWVVIVASVVLTFVTFFVAYAKVVME